MNRGVPKGPGDDLLSPAKDYHRPWMLNGRVRNGNGCGHPGMLTGSFVNIKMVAVELQYDLSRSPQERSGFGGQEEDQCGEAVGC